MNTSSKRLKHDNKQGRKSENSQIDNATPTEENGNLVYIHHRFTLQIIDTDTPLSG